MYSIHTIAMIAGMNTTRSTTTDIILDRPMKEPVKFTDYQNRYNKLCNNPNANDYILLSTSSEKSTLNITQSVPAPRIHRIDQTDPRTPISIALEHDVFDIQHGLVRNIIYSGNYCDH